jgi:polysaccharide export outer membrane protein
MNLRPFVLLAALVCSPLVQAQDSSKPSVPADAPSTTDAASKSNTPSVLPSDSEYKIGPQDVVRIDVWKEPDISRTIPVRPDGKISLPLLNDIQAAGLTALELGNSIRNGLTKYLTSPQVTVTVSEINSRRVYITGEVTRAGALPLLPNMTVLQALSSAGGFTQFAKLKAIYVLRNESGKQVKHPFNYKEVVKGKNQDENIPLLPGDVIVVP